MYEAYFGFRQRPFLAVPSLNAYFPAQAIEHARQTLMRCLERGQGPGLLIGPPGTGKSLLCQLLADHFRVGVRVCMLANSGLTTRRALLQSLLFEFGQRFREMAEGELRLSLTSFLESSPECPHGVLLIVDEAHALPVRLLEELRLLTNLARDGQARMRLLLSGGPALEERFTDPKLESFQQRIAARCYLQALNRDETYQYVRSQIGAADGDPDRLLAESALQAIYRATDGIPRLINQIGDATLMLAAERGVRHIDGSLVQEAWADLQQLPTPWQNPSTSETSPSGVIEFGQLSDESLPTKPTANSRDAAHSMPVEHEFKSPGVRTSSEQHLGDVTISADEPRRRSETISGSGDTAIESWLPDIAIRSPGVVNVEPARTPTPIVADPQSWFAERPARHELFGEGFEEEEVVIDRFNSLDSGVFASTPRVSCAEGRDISLALRRFAEQQAAVAQRRAETPTVVTPPAEFTPTVSVIGAGSEPCADAPLATDNLCMESIITTPGEPDLNWSLGDESVGGAAEEEQFEPAVHSHHELAATSTDADVNSDAMNDLETTPVEPDVAAELTPPRHHMRIVPTDDRDMIVFEEDGSAHRAPDPEQGRVRRQEYRTLFARLRRG